MSSENWKKIQEFYDEGHTWRDLQKKYNLSFQAISNAVKRNLLKVRSKKDTQILRCSKPVPKHSEKTKKLLSEKRKQFLKNNPEKHSWKNPNKHKSEPCRKAKEFLKQLGVQFIPEFSPEIDGRFFSIDIAIPDKMIALEINGQHHYQSDGSLKPYYQERHDLIEKAGWKVFEIHYSACFKFERWEEFALLINNSPHVREFDYFNYIPRQKRITKNNCPKCSNLKARISKLCSNCNKEDRKKAKRPRRFFGERKQTKTKEEIRNSEWVNCICGFNLKHPQAKQCWNCASKKSRKVVRPSKEELEKLIKEIPMTHIGKLYGVSDNAVKKWCRSYGITLPNMRGYWSKQKVAAPPRIELGIGD